MMKAAGKGTITAPQIALLLKIRVGGATKLLHAMRCEGSMVRTWLGDHATRTPAEWQRPGRGVKDAQPDTRNYLAELMCPAVVVPKPSLVVRGGSSARQHCEWCAMPLPPGREMYCSAVCSSADPYYQPDRRKAHV